ncbi:MAG: hypothetical protein Q9187_000692 [Circinaria calcarea]
MSSSSSSSSSISSTETVHRLPHSSRRWYLPSSPVPHALVPLRAFSRSQNSSPLEHAHRYEVAPGIWSTDATARVFGYLPEEEEKPASSRRGGDQKTVKPVKSARSWVPGPAKKLVKLYKEVHTDDGTDDFRRRTHRQRVEAWDRSRQEKRDAARAEREASEQRGRRARMGTVTREDELTTRGANPRTGLVSPWVISDDGKECGHASEYVNARALNAPENGRRKNNGKWKQDDQGWSLVGALIPVETTGKSDEEISRRMYAEKTVEKLVVNQPGVDGPDPPKVSEEQIMRIQGNRREALRAARREDGIVNVKTLTAPRQLTSEGPSSLSLRFSKITRKAVGSTPHRRDVSKHTVTVDDRARASSVSQVKQPLDKGRHIRILAPNSDSRDARPTDKSDIQRNTTGRDLSTATFGNPQALANSSIRKHSPNIQSLDLSSPSHLPLRCPIQKRLWPEHERESFNKDAADSCVASTKKPTVLDGEQGQSKGRPKVERKDGTENVPQVDRHADEVYRLRGQNDYLWGKGGHTSMNRETAGNAPMLGNQPEKLPYSLIDHTTNHVMDTWPSMHSTSGQEKPVVETYNGWVVSNPVPRHCPRTSQHRTSKDCTKSQTQGLEDTWSVAEHCWTSDTAGQNILDRGLRKLCGSAPKGGGLTRRFKKAETPIGGSLGKDQFLEIKDSRVRSRNHDKDENGKSLPSGEVPINSSLRERSKASQSSLDVERMLPIAFEKVQQAWGLDDDGGRRSPLVQQIDEVYHLWQDMDSQLQTSAKIQLVVHHLAKMAHHVLLTFHPSSPPVTVLKTRTGRAEDYIAAVKDVLQAALCLVLLLSVFMVALKALRVLMGLTQCALVLFRLAWAVVRWLSFS